MLHIGIFHLCPLTTLVQLGVKAEWKWDRLKSNVALCSFDAGGQINEAKYELYHKWRLGGCQPYMSHGLPVTSVSVTVFHANVWLGSPLWPLLELTPRVTWNIYSSAS